MTTRSRTLATLSLAMGLVMTMSGCGTDRASPGTGTTGGDHPTSQWVAADVVGAGTVIDTGGVVTLCAGVRESYPPQCAGGVVLTGWDWSTAPGSESASGVRWGDYTVTGRYDGTTLTVTAPPVAHRPGGGPDGPPPPGTGPKLSEAELATVMDGVVADLAGRVVSAGVDPVRGVVDVMVIHDDGSLQRELDTKHGAGVVVVMSWLRPPAD